MPYVKASASPISGTTRIHAGTPCQAQAGLRWSFFTCEQATYRKTANIYDSPWHTACEQQGKVLLMCWAAAGPHRPGAGVGRR